MKRKIVEIGACSLLDFEFSEKYPDLTWVKYYNNTQPKFYSQKIKIGNWINMAGVDSVIFSAGYKGPKASFHEYSSEDFSRVYDANMGVILRYLPEMIEKAIYSGIKRKFIFLGSVAGEGTYPTHTMYAMQKAALASLVRNLKEEYDGTRLEFHLLTIGYTQSRMTEGRGESPEKVRNKVMELVNSF